MPRENYRAIAPEAFRKLADLSVLMHQCSLEIGLVHLVYVRVSQLNGCAYCVDTHTREALEAGEKPQRLYALTVWRDTDFFTPRERAALVWAEAMTKISAGHPPKALCDELRRPFTEKEFVELTFAIATINALNRIGIGFEAQPKLRG